VKAEKAINAGKADTAKTAAATALSTLDKAASKGIIHPNNAARRKARLIKKLNAVK
jgi:small subunit ribosomal protein S20